MQTIAATSYPWKSNKLFTGLSADELNRLSPHLYELSFNNGQEIIRQGDEGSFIFLIHDGSAQVYNDELLLSELKTGDLVGLMSIMDNKPRSATVIAGSKGAKGYGISKESLQLLLDDQNIQLSNQVLLNYVRAQQDRMRNTNQLGLKETRARLDQEKKRTMSAHFFAQMVLGLIIFIFLLGFLTEMTHEVESTFISFGLLLAYSIWAFIFIRYSDFDLKIFGLTIGNFKPAMKLVMKFTLPFILMLFLLKWILITLWPQDYGDQIIDFYLIQENGLGFGLLIMTIYSMHAVLQEFIARSCIQGGLMEFVMGSWKEWKSIILASLMFSSFHIMIDVKYGFMTLIPGLMWGYLFYKHRNLLAVSISHILIGITALFVLNLMA